MNLLVAGGAAATGALCAMLVGWLRPRGAVVAGLVALAHVAGGGWMGGLLLATFVVSGSLLTRWLDPNGARVVRRSAGQVLANGGPAALAALVIPQWPTAGWPLLLGALATAQADTWATEIGRTSPHAPRDLSTRRVVPAGTSGGVTWRGTVAGAAGAVLLGMVAWPGVGACVAAAGAAGGLLGMTVDSAVGGPLQTRYLCMVCGSTTETDRHCKAPARHASGLRGLGNSAVNALSTAVGGLGALLLSGWFSC